MARFSLKPVLPAFQERSVDRDHVQTYASPFESGEQSYPIQIYLRSIRRQVNVGIFVVIPLSINFLISVKRFL